MTINDKLAIAITDIDKSANEWAFNKYCNQCGKFMFSEDLQAGRCRKCLAPVSDAIKRALPFSTSPTAMFKLLEWVRSLDDNVGILENISSSYHGWLFSNQSIEELHISIIATISQRCKIY